MPEIQAFRGVRYDLGHVGRLADVVAPPYDVISPQDQKRLYDRHPANVVRLILNRPEPGDDEHKNVYSRAAKFLKEWQRQGVLFTEGQGAIYVYHQEFKCAGLSLSRHGFLARVRLQRFGEGTIYPHEETMSGPKEDRFKLTVACRANLSPVFGLYPDPQRKAQAVLDHAVAGQTPLSATDHLGVVHKMWPVVDVGVISAVAGAMTPLAVFIADGHHRYETACNYRDHLAKSGPLDHSHPANFVLMACVAMSDPGMVVFPTHRLLRELPAMSSPELAAKLGECFSTRPAGKGVAAAHSVWEDMETLGKQEALAFYTPKDQTWLIAEPTAAGKARMRQAAAEHSAAWCSLGVAMLHRLVIETLLGSRNLPKPTYVHLVDEVVAQLARPEHTLAALVMPPTLAHIESISKTLERMPAKSTYFYPKLLSGLVINPLE
ncbi:MAG: DUF1015 domain-containing protein [Planctomycetia bacterium]|nr:DUF1015 domain-containing protein [Planctomycetia bacterium]